MYRCIFLGSLHARFGKWKAYFNAGFNILCHGFGSKQVVIGLSISNYASYHVILLRANRRCLWTLCIGTVQPRANHTLL